MKNQELKTKALAQERPLSAELRAWKESDEKIKELLEGSHVFTKPWDKNVAWKSWEDGRRFITDVINKDGKILDYGCANGFLLRSLQEWSGYKLEPYGFDIDESAIEKAKKLFPDKAGNFIGSEEQRRGQNLPQELDFVYWNVWDNWKFEKPEEVELLQKLQAATKKGGRLILGLYDAKEENIKRIEQLKKLGLQPTEVVENPRGEQMLAVFDRPTLGEQ